MLQGLKIWRGELCVRPKIWGASSKGGDKSWGANASPASPLPTCLYVLYSEKATKSCEISINYLSYVLHSQNSQKNKIIMHKIRAMLLDRIFFFN